MTGSAEIFAQLQNSFHGLTMSESTEQICPDADQTPDGPPSMKHLVVSASRLDSLPNKDQAARL